LIEYTIYFIIAVNALILLYINWKIFKLTRGILKVSIELLAETIIIRDETQQIRLVEEDIKEVLVGDFKEVGERNATKS
tara:strand:- start:356 stop:592 length:237 start_codon:yes stop_codon:yes gene_type:complete